MNKLLLTLSILVIPAFSYASGVQFGRIVDIKGSGFISYDGKTHEIKKGEAVYVDSEIIVESSGQVTFTDNADHRFHLGNSSTAAVFAGKVQLRSGDVWVQSLNKLDDYQLSTANATVNYQGGEAILSYDSVKGKTQLMVINGLMKFSNLRSPELNLTVAEGNFSFVDPSFEEGMPRDPTPAGQKTYGQLVAMFTGVAPMDKNSVAIFKDKEKEKDKENDHAPAARSIASVKTPVILPTPAPTVTASVKKTSTPVANKLIIKIYGQTGFEASATTAIYDIPKPETKMRAPASVLDSEVPGSSNMNTIPTTPQYKESDKLIDQLNKL